MMISRTLKFIAIAVFACCSIYGQGKDAPRSTEKKGELVVEALASVPASREPVIIDRAKLTDEEFERIGRDRDIRNLNVLLMRAESGEQRVTGRISKIECADDGTVRYVTAAGSVTLKLTSPDFRSVKLSILMPGTRDSGIGCGADISAEPVVIGYRRSGRENVLVSLHFVPEHFRLMSAAEIANAPLLIIRGGKASDISENERIAAEELAEFEKKRSSIELQQAEQSLRRPRQGEVRVVGYFERVVCGGGRNVFVFNAVGGQRLNLIAPSAETLTLVSHVRGEPDPQISCMFEPPKLKAVVTYVPEKHSADVHGVIAAIEFVPEGFALSDEN